MRFCIVLGSEYSNVDADVDKSDDALLTQFMAVWRNRKLMMTSEDFLKHVFSSVNTIWTNNSLIIFCLLPQSKVLNFLFVNTISSLLDYTRKVAHIYIKI